MPESNPLVSDYTILGSYGELHEVDIADSAGVNEVQELNIAGATGGTFTLTVNGETTTALAYNAIASVIQAALIALPSLVSGDVVVAGSAGVFTITFGGTFADEDVAQIAPDGSLLTGTSPTIAVTTNTQGQTPGTTSWLANINQVDTKITVNKIEVNRSGTRATGYKRGAIAGDGTMTGFKVTSRWIARGVQEMSDESNPAPPMVLDVKLDDPEALGAETVRLYNVKFWEFPFGFNVGDLIMEAVPFTFERAELLEAITGTMTE